MSLRATAAIVLAITLGLALALGCGPIDAGGFVHPRTALVFEDRNGLALGTLYTRDDEQSVAVKLGSISPHFIRATIAAEDARFGAHPGVDVLALARAAGQFVQSGHVRSGGSTIAMQLARTAYHLPHDVRGKLVEIALGVRITAGSSPSTILEAYCNRLPMGSDLVGVEAAARTYFGSAASDLDLAHASLLAALPNDPSRLDPYAHLAALRVRQAHVLERMVVTGAITRDDAEKALHERIVLVPRSRGVIAAAHLIFALSPAVEPDVARVRTTIDRPLQTFLEAQMRATVAALAERHVHDAAAVVLDNRSGEVLAYAGSPDYFAPRAGRVDGVRALRQPGSSLKPFLYELALERRTIRPATILLDAPVTYALPGARLYQPHDYSQRYAGPVRTRLALANSLNVPAVRVLERLGVPIFLERLRALGFAHLTRDPKYYGLGLALGSGEVSLWELARAYAMVANQGRLVPLSARLDRPTAQSALAVGDAASWALVTDMLADPFARARAFGVDSILRTPFSSAVKTGTSSDFRDTWTIGYSRDYTVATWVGNFDGTPMQRVSGVTGAGPLYSAIMLHLHERREPQRFGTPAGYVRREICAETGARPAPGCRALVQEWLDPGDLARYERTPRAFAHAASALRIANPSDGDRFVSYPQSGRSQRIALRAEVPAGARVDWSLNGRSLGTHDPEVLWSLRPGEYTLMARSAGVSSRVRFVVELPRESSARRGFTVVPPRG